MFKYVFVSLKTCKFHLEPIEILWLMNQTFKPSSNAITTSPLHLKPLSIKVGKATRPFRCLSSGCYKNKKNLRNFVNVIRYLSSRRYKKNMVESLRWIRYLNSGQKYFNKFAGRVKKWVRWQKKFSHLIPSIVCEWRRQQTLRYILLL
jgi:hypothetical protein